MANPVPHEILEAAMIKAIQTGLIPRHSLLADYLKSWARLEMVIQIAIEKTPTDATTAKHGRVKSRGHLQGRSRRKNRW